MAEKDWYETFGQHMNPIFTKKDFKNYKKGILKDLKYYNVHRVHKSEGNGNLYLTNLGGFSLSTLM